MFQRLLYRLVKSFEQLGEEKSEALSLCAVRGREYIFSQRPNSGDPA